MNIAEILNRTDRFAANAGCKITEVTGRRRASGIPWISAECLFGNAKTA